MSLFARHMCAICAHVQLGSQVTGPALRLPTILWKGPIEPLPTWGTVHVPAGLAAAARQTFPATDAGRWETVRRGVVQQLAPGEALALRRLDALRAPEAVTLRHAVLGDIRLPAWSEMTAWNVREFLTDEQRDSVRLLVTRMFGGDREARATIEAMLPAAHWALREAFTWEMIKRFAHHHQTLLRFDAAM